ncbi:MAG: molybdenum cofactor biosynthesis protein MoaE [Gammaproteobacteria bacterium]|nr:molybdenum cofactor biosynthesis protein MoaE [Gammaproteobacteria bacterium]
MKVVVQHDVLDPYKEIKHHEDKVLESGKHGGVVSFVGTMRDFNDGEDVTAMNLDHYPGMTEKHIEAVCQEAMDGWDVMDVLVVHRVGDMYPSDPIVLVAVWSAHRASAFDACRYVINYLKERAPFWKCEVTTEGKKIWVEHNSKDPGVAESREKLA